jgi:molecular chaperone GrpE
MNQPDIPAEDEAVVPSEAAEPAEPAEAPPSPLDVAQGRVQELEDRLRRAEAEFLNETRRIRRQADEQGRYAAERVVVDLLPVLDALRSARAALGEGDADKTLQEGLDLVDRQLADVLGRHGVERIDPVDEPFDPNCHEAMLMADDPGRPAQTVSQVLRPGYRLHGRVVRPAQVIVARGGPTNRPTGEAPDADV